MDQSIRIRKARPGDRDGIDRVRRASIGLLCAGHYSGGEILAWQDDRPAADTLAAIRDRVVLVAAAGARVAGYAELRPDEWRLEGLYVQPGRVRGGIGGTLLACIETEARGAGCAALRLDAALNAVPFFLSRGYLLQGTGTIALRGGTAIACVHMRKDLGAAG